MLVTSLITGCTANAILNEITREEANAFRSRVTNNPGLVDLRKRDYGVLATKDLLPTIKPEEAEEGTSNTTGTARSSDNTAENTQDAFWVKVHVAAGILANDKNVEKFEEGTVRAQLASGEIFKGNFLGYRPRSAEHCTRSWISNLYYFDSRGGHLSWEGGVAVLTGGQGTALLCAYGWVEPDCEREGICKAKESKYYKLKF